MGFLGCHWANKGLGELGGWLHPRTRPADSPLKHGFLSPTAILGDTEPWGKGAIQFFWELDCNPPETTKILLTSYSAKYGVNGEFRISTFMPDYAQTNNTSEGYGVIAALLKV